MPRQMPVVPTHQLGHHTVERRALGDRVAVGAVAGVDGIVIAQLAADGRRDALLPDAQVDQPMHLVGALELPDPLLEVADPPHRPEQAKSALGVEGARLRSGFRHCA